MQHLLLAKCVVGHGDASIVVEPRGGSIRIKPRHGPELFLPYELAHEIGTILQGYAAAVARVTR